MRPHYDYSDIIYDQPNNEMFNKKKERIQYNTALAITGAIKGTSRSKLHSEKGFEPPNFRLWFRKLCTLYEIKNWCTKVFVWPYSEWNGMNLEWNNLDWKTRELICLLEILY